MTEEQHATAKPQAEQPFGEQLAAQLGGVRGLIEASVPVGVFVVVNLIWDLRPAIITAVGSALAIAAWRLFRRETVRHALNGLFGIAVGAYLAWKSGDAEDFYLPGILIGLVYGVAMLVSVLFRQPAVGWVWAVVAGGGKGEWRANPRLLRIFTWLTVLWGVVWLAKNIVRWALYAMGADTSLGVVTIVAGYPVTGALVAITIWAVRKDLSLKSPPTAA
ncbi:DUF3159 domain-containing protein [Phytomonospora endophytica]|uniref:DUF3159 domain-containing protein n=1 Tax=Phytomonospora endophytica TaxID=714109 RepID=A0A841FC68_9ACTN|nr:DUF3159 domain-containing protein [Phytomonospora endophytica]MBB6034881.1 hypothetical protein [Phytomonospora endophytica]GIG70585.1 hypothetical protein Pen01_68800 [Phytomonospora endophytica]